MNVKELKEFLASLPEEANAWDVVFGTSELPGLYVIAGANESYYRPEDIPEGCTENFILLWNGKRP